MKIKCYHCENENSEIFIEGSRIVIKDKIHHKYYENFLDSESKVNLAGMRIHTPKVSKVFALVFLFLFLILCLYTYFFQQNYPVENVSLTVVSIVTIALYLIINVALHEMAHVLSLKYMGRKYNKIGFKMNYYVFPGVYVQMNELHMLSKYEKVVVHGAGIFLNLICINLLQVLNFTYIHSNELLIAFLVFKYSLIWNIIPLLNSDGVKILMTLTNQTEKTNFRSNGFLIRGVKIISSLFAVKFMIELIYIIIHFILKKG